MNSHTGLFPPWFGALFCIAFFVTVVWGVGRRRVAQKLRAWKKVARELTGNFEIVQGKMRVVGRYRGRKASLGEAVSHEDAIPYPHTYGRLALTNPARAVLGLRHKSVLEEVTQRNEKSAVPTSDPEFDRAFFLVLTVPEQVETLLSPEVRKTLKKITDVEIYLRGANIEWRRADTVVAPKEILRLFETLSDIADALDALPPRSLSLSAMMAEDALIEKGV